MNILVESSYALHNLWGRVKNTIYSSKVKYYVLPLIYLVVIFSISPTLGNNIASYSYTYANLDSYQEVTISNDEKLKYILKEYNLTKEQFNVLKAIVLSEAQGNSYEDAYAVINTIYNRTHSKAWVKSINNKFGKGTGRSLYYQAISPGQFTVYKSGAYKKHLNNTKSVGYTAILDFLYTKDIMHNYLSFRSHSIKKKNSECFSSKGNNYFQELKEENRI
jgi:hypothetical protein